MASVNMDSLLDALSPGTDLPENLTKYVVGRVNSFTSYTEEPNLQESLVKYSAEIRSRGVDDVRNSAIAGNASDCLEMGLRAYTGCGARKDVKGAYMWWTMLADPTHSQSPSHVRRLVRARAFSCLANAEFDSATADPDEWNIDALCRAGVHADACAALGLITPVVLNVASRIEGVGARRRSQWRFPMAYNPRFETLTALWAVADRRKKEVEEKTMKRDAKVSMAPNLYRCAAEGCGIEATSKSGLLKCAGRCATDVKPSYCSKECQKQDWKRHKPACVPNASSSSSNLANESTATPLNSGSLPRELPDHLSPEHFNRNGKEHTLEFPAPGLPGGTMKVSSKTASTAYMKEMRDEVEKALREGG